MATTRLADYLSHILDAETMAHDKSALELIARAADGSVRDSLSLVEQAAAFGGGEVRADDVESMLGRVSTARLIELIAAIADADAKSLFEQVETLAQYSPDYIQVTGELLSLLHRIAMYQSVPESIDDSLAGSDQLCELSSQISAEQIQLYYQIGQHARRDMPYSSDQREAFDMALLRMIAFAPQPDVLSSSITKVSTNKSASASATAQNTATGGTDDSKPAPNHAALENPAPADKNTKEQNHAEPSGVASDSSAGSKKNSVGRQLAAEAIAAANAPDSPVPVPSATIIPTSTSASIPAEVPGSGRASLLVSTVVDDLAIADKGTQAQTKPAVLTDSPGKPAAKAQGRPVELGSINADNWAATVDQIGLAGMPRQLAAQCVFNTRDGNRLNLQMEQAQEHLNTKQFCARFQTALSAYTGTDVTITIETVSTDLNTPAKVEQQKKDDALSAARAAIDDDPMVKQLLSSIDGVVDAKSVQPVETVQSASNKQD